MKKSSFWLSCGLLIALGLVLAACAPQTVLPTEAPAQPARPDEGTLMDWWDGNTLAYYACIAPGAAPGSPETIFMWVYRSEVTNYQYSLCVEAGDCQPATGELADINNPDLANSPAQIIGPDDQQEYCNWAGGHLPSEEEAAHIEAQTADGASPNSILIGLVSPRTEHGIICIVDAPTPMARACQTSAFYVNGPPADIDHTVTPAGEFCQNGKGYVTLDINMSAGSTIQSVTGDCEVVGDNRVLCSGAPGSSINGQAFIHDKDLLGAGGLQCSPSYESSADSPATCTIIGPEISRRDESAGQVSLVAYQPNVRLQDCPSGQYHNLQRNRCEAIPTCPGGMYFNRNTESCECQYNQYLNRFNGVCEDIPTCPAGQLFDRVRAVCYIPTPTPPVCARGTRWNVRTLTCDPICADGGTWDPVTSNCYYYAPLPGCPPGTVPDPYTGMCAAPSELHHRCLEGFHLDEVAYCCQTDLPSGRFVGCPLGQAIDPSTGACDLENTWVAGIRVLHTVEFSYNLPSCAEGDSGGGNACGSFKDKTSCTDVPGCNWDSGTNTCY